MSRVVISEHRTQLNARRSRRRWKKRQQLAREGNPAALAQLKARRVHTEGRIHEEHGGAHTQQKWGVFYEPPGPPAESHERTGPSPAIG
jgi:hypothetical protein